MTDHPGTLTRATPPQRGTLFRDGMRVSSPIRRKGELRPRRYWGSSHIRRKGELFRDGNVLSSPPLEGWAKPGVVREYGISHLLSCHSRTRGPRKYDRICGVVKAGIRSIKLCRGLQINKNTTLNYFQIK